MRWNCEKLSQIFRKEEEAPHRFVEFEYNRILFAFILLIEELEYFFFVVYYLCIEI